MSEQMNFSESATIFVISVTSAIIIYLGFYFESWQPVLRFLSIMLSGLVISTVLWISILTLWGTISSTKDGVKYLETIDKKFEKLSEEIDSIRGQFYRSDEFSKRIRYMEQSVDELIVLIKKDSQTTATVTTDEAAKSIIS